MVPSGPRASIQQLWLDPRRDSVVVGRRHSRSSLRGPYAMFFKSSFEAFGWHHMVPTKRFVQPNASNDDLQTTGRMLLYSRKTMHLCPLVTSGGCVCDRQWCQSHRVGNKKFQKKKDKVRSWCDKVKTKPVYVEDIDHGWIFVCRWISKRSSHITKFVKGLVASFLLCYDECFPRVNFNDTR